MEHYEHDKHMYKAELEELLKQDQEIWKACLEEIEKRKELRHKRVMERQIRKFNKCLKSQEEQDQKQGGHSNHHGDCSKEQGPESNDRAKKWAINLSSIPLTKDQESLPAYGPNFVITPQKPPLGEYITNIEKACQSLDTNTVEELRSEIYRVLRQPHQLKPNLKKEEIKAMKQLKADKDCMVLTTDKGLVIIYRKPKNYWKTPIPTEPSRWTLPAN